MNVRYRVELNQAERGELTALLSGGKHAARKLKRAQILLAADAGASKGNIATSVGVGGFEYSCYRRIRPLLFRDLSGRLLVRCRCRDRSKFSILPARLPYRWNRPEPSDAGARQAED